MAAWLSARVGLLAGVLIAVSANAAAGQDAGVDAAAAEDPRLRDARHIRELIAGTLDPAIDPAALFVVELAPGSGDDLGPVLGELDRPARRRRPVADDPVDALARARAAFLALPAARRQALLGAHAARAREALEAREAAARQRTALAAVSAQIAELRAFLTGTLDRDDVPAHLLRVDLLDPRELALADARRARYRGDDAAPAPAGPDAALVAAEAELDELRRRYLALSPEEREALFAAHRATRAALAAAAALPKVDPAIAEAAAREREASEALERARAEAIAARTEAERAVAEERARLLAARQAQLDIEASFTAMAARQEVQRERALRWKRRVAELRRTRDQRAADAAYGELVAELEASRATLEDELSAVSSGSEVAGAGSRPSVDDATLRELHDELAGAASELRARETALRWQQVTVTRDATVAMNRERLRLLAALSPQRRGELEGFGPEGVAQAERELTQIRLEAWYRVHAIPRELDRIAGRLGARPLDTASLALQLLVIVLVFRWWRRRAPGLFERGRRSWTSRRPQTRVTLAAAAAMWYADRLHPPIGWLLVLALIGRVVHDDLLIDELSLLWIIAVWILVANLAVRALDAVAARQPGFQNGDPTAGLRYRSLHLIRVTVVGVGLVLSLASELVGKGAIYSWVWRTCWVLSVPVVVTLLVWWKKTIFARAEAHHHPNVALRWVLAHPRGLASLPATMLGAVVLLIEGTYRFALRQLSHLSATRRVLAYLFRREVEKQAATRGDTADRKPLPSAIYDQLAPALDDAPLLDHFAGKQIAFASELVRQDNNAVIAVVGERGTGKTACIRRVLDGLDADEVVSVTAPAGGFDRLRAVMARARGLPAGCAEEALVADLRERRPRVIAIDDAQRLIKPLIGGLSDIDRLVALAHRVGPTTSWLVCIGGPAWQYLRRARGDRAVFDHVLALPRLDQDQLQELTRARSEAVGIRPRFDDLIVPRQLDDAQLSKEERTERDYHAILWDYSDGNAMVALHCWRESLYMRGDEVYVKLFQTPALEGLEGLPGSMHFVLRSIVQMELASADDIAACTDLHPTEVADALRVAHARKYIENIGDRVRISVAWYRPIVKFLRRQHLLVTPGGSS